MDSDIFCIKIIHLEENLFFIDLYQQLFVKGYFHTNYNSYQCLQPYIGTPSIRHRVIYDYLNQSHPLISTRRDKVLCAIIENAQEENRLSNEDEENAVFIFPNFLKFEIHSIHFVLWILA